MRQVLMVMPDVSSAVYGKVFKFPNPLMVGECEGLVQKVGGQNGVLEVELELSVDGVYLTKLRATICGNQVLWSPIRVEERK